MRRLDPGQRGTVFVQNIHPIRQPTSDDKVPVFRNLQPIRTSLQRLEYVAFITDINSSRGRAVDIKGKDVAVVGRGEVDADGVVVEVAFAAAGLGADCLEPGVGDVERFTVAREGDAVRMLERGVCYGDFAGRGPEAVGGQVVLVGEVGEAEAVGVVCV